MNFEAPLTSLVWLTSIVSVVLTYVVSRLLCAIFLVLLNYFDDTRDLLGFQQWRGFPRLGKRDVLVFYKCLFAAVDHAANEIASYNFV